MKQSDSTEECQIVNPMQQKTKAHSVTMLSRRATMRRCEQVVSGGAHLA